jgi:hypothetical protein
MLVQHLRRLTALSGTVRNKRQDRGPFPRSELVLVEMKIRRRSIGGVRHGLTTDMVSPRPPGPQLPRRCAGRVCEAQPAQAFLRRRYSDPPCPSDDPRRLQLVYFGLAVCNPPQAFVPHRQLLLANTVSPAAPHGPESRVRNTLVGALAQGGSGFWTEQLPLRRRAG